jgi:mitochondrial fission protein ELM1
VLSAGKPGDDAQATMLAAAVGWPYEVKRVGVDRLEAPWPDVVISFGRVTEVAARGIAVASRGSARIVQLGRPHGPLARLDLVVALPQYALPAHPRVVRLALPLQRVSLAAVAGAAAAWTPPPGQVLPRPWIAVLVGGTARPYAMDVPAARDLGERVSAAARAAGGALLVTTSRRTAPAAADALARAISAPAVVHRWSAGGSGNPYLAFLGVADRIVVTADSASMIADAVSTAKPVEIFPLPRERWRPARLRDVARRLAWGAAGSAILGTPLASLIARLGIRPPRDLARLHARLYEHGLAAPFGAPPPARRAAAGTEDELAVVAARVRALVTGPRAHCPPRGR